MSEEIMNIGSAEGDQVLELDINRLRAFKNHPFKVTADMSMVELKDSIEKYGILNPLIVRPVPEGYYEITSYQLERTRRCREWLLIIFMVYQQINIASTGFQRA